MHAATHLTPGGLVLATQSVGGGFDHDVSPRADAAALDTLIDTKGRTAVRKAVQGARPKEGLFVEERRRLKINPNAFGERAS
jgi:hypothetical protein